MIIDSFTFFNEFDLLEFRLRLLYDVVDRFVLVEADKTFSGKDKPFHFEQNKARFAWAQDKLITHKAYLSTEGLALGDKPHTYNPHSAFFKLEYQQRNAIADACHNFDDHDILLLSDLDEIPSKEAIAFARSDAGRNSIPFVCDQKLFYYNLNCLAPTPWRGTLVTTMEQMRIHSPQKLRDARNQLRFLPHAGWHLSYFGNADFIANKIDSFAHQEFNTDTIKDRSRIEECIRTGADLYGRNYVYSPFSQQNFPEYFLALAQQNKPFFFGNAAQ